jgi:hypothetical protein
MSTDSQFWFDSNAYVDISRARIPDCLALPVATVDEVAITRHVGTIVEVLSGNTHNKAFKVSAYTRETNNSLAIFNEKNASRLHDTHQVWVHVDYTGYLKAYQKAMPVENWSLSVVDHIMNRRHARKLGFNYLRVIPISRVNNSSHGGTPEKWENDFLKDAAMLAKYRSLRGEIRYADFSEIIKMMDIGTGGGHQSGIYELEYLLEAVKL